MKHLRHGAELAVAPCEGLLRWRRQGLQGLAEGQLLMLACPSGTQISQQGHVIEVPTDEKGVIAMSDQRMNALGNLKVLVSPIGLDTVGMAGFNNHVNYRQFEGAIEFVKLHPAVSTVLLGAQNVDGVRENISSSVQSAPKAFWRELKSCSLIPENAPTE